MDFVVKNSHSHSVTFSHEEILRMNKMDKDEKISREALYRAWDPLLRKYAEPGAYIPPTDQVRKEMLKLGVKAAVDALVSEHWWMCRWMVEGEIESKVNTELTRFDLDEFMDDVRIAQSNPEMFHRLEDKLRRYVLEGL